MVGSWEKITRYESIPFISALLLTCCWELWWVKRGHRATWGFGSPVMAFGSAQGGKTGRNHMMPWHISNQNPQSAARCWRGWKRQAGRVLTLSDWNRARERVTTPARAWGGSEGSVSPTPRGRCDLENFIKTLSKQASSVLFPHIETSLF